MRWERYKEKFINRARLRGLSDNEISFLLNYAKPIHDKGLIQLIFDILHFSKLVGYQISYIERAIQYPHFFYRHYSVPKKVKEYVIFLNLFPSLKEIQKWILDEIFSKIKVSKYAKAM